MVKGMPHINHPIQLCEACLLGKHARRSFPKEAELRENEPLQIVHTNTLVYFLKQKYEAFVIFKNFKALVEKESGYVIKALRSDRGGKFTSKEFNEFCEKNEIHRPLTVPRTPQQNGVVERKNRTILNMARCINVKGQTPEEAWSGVKPSVHHFRVFGCVSYAHVPNQGRSKLDDRSVKHVFIGYDANSKGYKLYNPNNGKMIVSRDIEFDEEEAWNWEKEEVTYDFLPYYEEGDQEVVVPNEFTTPPPSPTPSIHEASSSEGSSSERTQKMRSIQEIYDETEIINDLFCLFVDSEPLTFDEAMEDKRLVAKGYKQQYGIDYDEVFTPVACMKTIRLLISIVAQMGWRIFQLDVKSTFLNGYLDENVYVEQPMDFSIKGQEEKVLKLKKVLYGLKQAPRAWNCHIDKYF
ncbi:hypothetical protein CR513_50318, partial [Mucuna pruriens]